MEPLALVVVVVEVEADQLVLLAAQLLEGLAEIILEEQGVALPQPTAMRFPPAPTTRYTFPWTAARRRR